MRPRGQGAIGGVVRLVRDGLLDELLDHVLQCDDPCASRPKNWWEASFSILDLCAGAHTLGGGVEGPRWTKGLGGGGKQGNAPCQGGGGGQ